MTIQLPPMKILVSEARKLIAENPERRNPLAPAGDSCLYNGPDGTHCIAAQLLINCGVATSEDFANYDAGCPGYPNGASIDRLLGPTVDSDSSTFLLSLQRQADDDARPRAWGEISVVETNDGYFAQVVH